MAHIRQERRLGYVGGFRQFQRIHRRLTRPIQLRVRLCKRLRVLRLHGVALPVLHRCQQEVHCPHRQQQQDEERNVDYQRNRIHHCARTGSDLHPRHKEQHRPVASG